MNAVLAQAIAREAIKKKPELSKAKILVKEQEPDKEPQRCTELKKAEVLEKKPIEVNAQPLPVVELKKAVIVERPILEVNSEPVAKVQLKKAEVKEKQAIQVNSSPAIKVELKKTSEKPIEKLQAQTSSAPIVALRHLEVEDKASTKDDEEPKLMATLRKPGKGRFRSLEQYYE